MCATEIIGYHDPSQKSLILYINNLLSAVLYIIDDFVFVSSNNYS
jgi:hypothetical protein